MPVYDSAATIGDTTNGGVPNITGSITQTYGTWRDLSVSGAFTKSGTYGTKARGESGSSTLTIGFDASRSSAVYDSGTTVRPAGVYMNWIIKAF